MKIAVASCTKFQQTNPQPVWQEIIDEKPDILLLLGDNIYLDHDHHSDPEKLRRELNQLYSTQLAESNFKALITDLYARGGKLLSIYDDHDFIGNDRYGGDQDPLLREASRDELILAFSPPMTGEDVYSVTHADLVDIIVLDERFYRQSPSELEGDRDAILGAKQWIWFESIVESSTAEYLIVASSTTFHKFINESWEQYPMAFERMRQLLSGQPGRVIISGDVHRNAMYDDSGVMEIVTSAVARNSVGFGRPRKNYGIFTFDDNSMQVELRSLKAGWRFDVSIPLADWQL